MSQRFDIAVVGGGIAGLATAEIFARAGSSVVLLEREATVCAEASGAHHGWFHFGSLYSIFPQNQFLRTMVGGVEDLLAHYRGFPGMNIRVTGEGRLEFPQDDGAWFRDEPIEYIVCARNDPDFDMRKLEGVRSYARKIAFLLTWEMAIKQFISRHQRFHRHDWSGPVPASHWIPRAGFADYRREVISKPSHPGINLDVDTHFRIVGYDRPMRSTAIVTDLVRAAIGAGVEIRTGAEVQRLEQAGGRRRLALRDGSALEASRVVVSAGRWLGPFLARVQDAKVVASPLLVAWPAVTRHNFVRMTPFVEKSVNHLHHEVDGEAYSLIGGGYFADPADAAAVARASERLIAMARGVFPRLAEASVVEPYMGYKTEIAPKAGERNYQYIIREIDEGVHAVLPGKFSLGFSLAVNAFRRITGEETVRGTARLAEASLAAPHVGLTRHGAIVRAGMARHGAAIRPGAGEPPARRQRA